MHFECFRMFLRERTRVQGQKDGPIDGLPQKSLSLSLSLSLPLLESLSSNLFPLRIESDRSAISRGSASGKRISRFECRICPESCNCRAPVARALCSSLSDAESGSSCPESCSISSASIKCNLVRTNAVRAAVE
jgi:hypothetical protein